MTYTHSNAKKDLSTIDQRDQRDLQPLLLFVLVFVNFVQSVEILESLQKQDGNASQNFIWNSAKQVLFPYATFNISARRPT